MFILKDVVFWGCEYDEYDEIFDFGVFEEGLFFFGCGDGFVSFNVEGMECGWNIVFCDFFYVFFVVEIGRWIEEVCEEVFC